MKVTTNNAETNNSGEEPRGDYPETWSKKAINDDQDAFMQSVGAASEGMPEGRVFRNFDELDQIPEGFEINIEPKDTGSFSDSEACFVYAIPTVEAIEAMGEAGKDFIRQCVASTLNRKASSYQWAVNRKNGAFSAPLDINSWLEGAKPSSSSGGVRFSKKGWNAVSEVIVNAINGLYKSNNHPARINKRELSRCMASVNDANALHPVIKAWDSVFTQAETLIKEEIAKPESKLTDKELEVLTHWKATRDQQATNDQLEITELKFD